MEIKFSKNLYRGKQSYDNMAYLQNKIKDCRDKDIDLILVYKKNNKMGASFKFLLPSLPYLSDECKSMRLHFPQYIKNRLVDMSYHKIYDKNIGEFGDKGQVIKLLKTKEDVFSLVPYVIKQAPITMNDKLQEYLISKIGEIYNNSFEHSKSKVVFGGKYYKANNNIFCFSCYDIGIGICQNVKKLFRGRHYRCGSIEMGND